MPIRGRLSENDMSNGDAAFWDRIARKYASDPIADMPGYERSVQRTRDYLKPGDSAYEFGCGTGTTALKLASSLARLVATDIAPGMIEIAREKAAAEGCTNVTFEVGTPETASHPDASFDAALGFNILHLVRDRAAVLRGVNRLLKPGGLVITKTPCLGEMNPLLRLAVPVARLFGKAPYVSFFKAEALEQDIVAAGFEIVERARHGSNPRKEARIFLVGRKL
jgi:ubiquinone/menaquinone biosynthesis C-methylase UbiE